ncbi:hypothetical protein DMP07_04355 [Slackia faecicanis]|uniref:Rho termination factor N-terminal domain-containing protein n=1 Tax=Slackia faecicanis TaxID=255723 RepID=A0A3N0AGK5_9ACTN|nr:Rho termination factor N-terminal domain-containing protein [Slackia faecicanis]RNL20815.1 hypothetical protein DMP07_04355 [Slackia faecicanis]
MIAAYEPKDEGKRLNVRTEPAYSAPVARLMEPGSEQCFEVVGGWCRLADGWADATFLTVRDGEPNAEGTASGEEKPADEQEPAEAPEDGGDALRRMTVKELRALAEESGIDVPKGATKEEIVHAVLAG